jgi:hypothetical protein
MDKSQAYIKMCTKAVEIQRQWQPRHGDVYVDDTDRIFVWIAHLENLPKLKKGFCITSENGVIKMTRYVWLPKLDQLIEMAQQKGKRYEGTSQDFFDWAKSRCPDGAKRPAKATASLEQLWLAFVMIRKFSKHWNGSEWKTGPIADGKIGIPVIHIDI